MKRVYLWEPDGHTLHLPTVRRAAVALAKFAVGGDMGRKPPDPVHAWVTEGRREQWEAAFVRGHKWAVDMVPYSSCGDLAHWLLMLLGSRNELVVNRGDDGGVIDWKPGPNITRLVKSKFYLPAGAGCPEPQEGDILHVAYPEHIAVLLKKVSDMLWITGDFGQPYAKSQKCEIERTAGGLIVRRRKLQGHVSLATVIELGGLTESAIVPNDFEFGVADDNPYDEDLRIPAVA